MFDRLEDILIHFEELQAELSSPYVTEDPARFRKLMKEQADLTPLVEAYSEYKAAKQDVEDSLLLLEEESDEETPEAEDTELMMVPQVASGCFTPSPRKDRVDSVRMTLPTPIVAVTISCGMTLGTR